MDDKPKLLLLEDDDLSAELTCNVLKDVCNAGRATAGQSALEAVSESRLDLVLPADALPGWIEKWGARLRGDMTSA